VTAAGYVLHQSMPSTASAQAQHREGGRARRIAVSGYKPKAHPTPGDGDGSEDDGRASETQPERMPDGLDRSTGLARWDGAGAPGGPPKAEPGAGSAGPGAA
jgi:hypothetical protein